MIQNAADAKGATFSPNKIYRYRLWRILDATNPRRIVWIMLNPSTADATTEDNTIRRCMRFSQQWGYGRMEILNLFALRSTNPAGLKEIEDPIGPDNDRHIREVCGGADRIVVAWGVHGTLNDRDTAVLDYLLEMRPVCLGITKPGHPRHPLYVPADFEPIPYRTSGRTYCSDCGNIIANPVCQYGHCWSCCLD